MVNNELLYVIVFILIIILYHYRDKLTILKYSIIILFLRLLCVIFGLIIIICLISAPFTYIVDSSSIKIDSIPLYDTENFEKPTLTEIFNT